MISNRCARKYLVTNCNSIISKNYLRFLVDSNGNIYIQKNPFVTMDNRIKRMQCLYQFRGVSLEAGSPQSIML